MWVATVRRMGEADDAFAALTRLREATQSRAAADAAATLRRFEQMDAVCAALAAEIPVSLIMKLTGLSRSRIDQIRREHCRSVDDDDGHETP